MSDDMHDPFERLKGATAPAPSEAAKKRALAAGAADALEKPGSLSEWRAMLTRVLDAADRRDRRRDGRHPAGGAERAG